MKKITEVSIDKFGGLKVDISADVEMNKELVSGSGLGGFNEDETIYSVMPRNGGGFSISFDSKGNPLSLHINDIKENAIYEVEQFVHKNTNGLDLYSWFMRAIDEAPNVLPGINSTLYRSPAETTFLPIKLMSCIPAWAG